MRTCNRPSQRMDTRTILPLTTTTTTETVPDPKVFFVASFAASLSDELRKEALIVHEIHKDDVAPTSMPRPQRTWPRHQTREIKQFTLMASWGGADACEEEVGDGAGLPLNETEDDDEDGEGGVVTLDRNMPCDNIIVDPDMPCCDDFYLFFGSAWK
mmetsp:Transcript_16748/g.47689  ORF Transcript_16748/g.47689 Transcript_16748/m.47689 type:complete len:157 (+) Transcript_16748:49-519(+)